jgi:ubiquitin C-terminal hydrolase
MIQLLLSNVELCASILSKHNVTDDSFNAVKKFIENYFDDVVHEFQTKKVFAEFVSKNSENKKYLSCNQEDAMEFFGDFLDAIEKFGIDRYYDFRTITTKKCLKSKNPTTLKEDFISEKEETLKFLQLPVPVETTRRIPMKELVSNYFKEEQIKGYKCGKKDNNDYNATSKIDFENGFVPKNLIIQLKRFEGTQHKIKTLIDILKIYYTYEDKREIIYELIIEDKEKYHLKSFIVHVGELPSSGHYYCYKKVGKVWFKIDDDIYTMITVLNDKMMLEDFAKAYIYYFVLV